VAIAGQGTAADQVARTNALSALLTISGGNQIQQAAAGIMQKALAANAAINPVLSATLPPVIQTAFTVGGAQLNTGIAQQLKQVARIIDARTALGVKRQVFFVSMGGYDTHSNTVTNQTNLFNQLAPALKAFYDYTVARGVDQRDHADHVGLQPHVHRQRQRGRRPRVRRPRAVMGGAVQGRRPVRHVPAAGRARSGRCGQQRLVDPDDRCRPGRRDARQVVRRRADRRRLTCSRTSPTSAFATWAS
jgi:hypothetical protein